MSDIDDLLNEITREVTLCEMYYVANVMIRLNNLIAKGVSIPFADIWSSAERGRLLSFLASKLSQHIGHGGLHSDDLNPTIASLDRRMVLCLRHYRHQNCYAEFQALHHNGIGFAQRLLLDFNLAVNYVKVR
jgi:hypothetical protein